MSTKLYVGNLSFQTQEDELRSTFSQYGEVIDVRIMTDRDTGRSRGFGFVEMADAGAAESAINAMNGAELDGRSLRVNEARPQENRGSGGGGGGGGRGGYGGGGGGGGGRGGRGGGGGGGGYGGRGGDGYGRDRY